MFPRGDEYQEAVQAPAFSFSDAELKQAQVESTPLGFPRAYSGGFTTTYHLTGSDGRQWAARCFLREVPHLERRYASLHLPSRTLPFLVESELVNEGIRIGGRWWPIIKMHWVDGLSLSEYITRYQGDMVVLRELTSSFQRLIARMDAAGVAHGDLQHGNIMVRDHRLYLIDYDDFFLPALEGLSASRGHPNYQHPDRERQAYSARLDRFSAIVIWLSLRALTCEPTLWKTFHTGENLLFTQTDYDAPGETPVFRSLQAITELKPFVDRLAQLCREGAEAVPSLSEFLEGASPRYDAGLRLSRPKSEYDGAYAVLDGSRKADLLGRIGERVEVIATITGFKDGSTKHGKPYLFLNAGRFPRQTFTVTIWSEGLEQFKAADQRPYACLDRTISVIGVLSAWTGRPTICIDSPKQIQFLTAAEAAYRLGRGPRPASAPADSPAHDRACRSPGHSISDDTISRSEAHLANRLFGRFLS